jgi:hypothetical protein
VPANVTGTHLSLVRHRLTREERRDLAREILARLDAMRATEHSPSPEQLELLPVPDQREER